MMRYHPLFFGFCLCFVHISGSQNAFRPVAIPDEAYFAEPFDARSLDRNWVLSKVVKDEQLKLLKYNGEWVVEETSEPRFLGNRGLVLKSPGRHHAISAYLREVYYFKDKPLCLQYEVFFQKVVDCGGAYIKLLSHSDDLRLSQFSDATPYTIMFGPDKCGSTHKVHFILSHRNPITGTYEEKHARQPEMDLSDYFIDRRPHLYTLNIYPDNTFEIFIDLTLINKGNLLEDMDPPVASPHETQEPEYSSNAALMDGFQTSDLKLEHERSDGVEGHRNDCTEASDCERSSHPALSNPAFSKPKNQPSRNPNDKGSRGEQSFTISPVAAVGFELWTLTGDVMFDNILLCDSLEVARRWTEDTWRQPPGMIEKLLVATVKRPWLWGVYVFTVGLPIILFISFMWPNKRFGPPDQDYYYKKTDEPQADRPQDMEEHITPNDGVNQTRVEAKSRAVKRALRNSDITS
ncbi:calnexin [Megalobrama amblycephala]|uniref:calnexin n=1 Tax=Megalobrama amblycephala TaxID=75352 RepID=UPI002013D2A5|nr:calnexin [Megalobrama amblycephala]XP_048035610.1 calnexin [Megalobrama amblycephala]